VFLPASRVRAARIVLVLLLVVLSGDGDDGGEGTALSVAEVSDAARRRLVDGDNDANG